MECRICGSEELVYYYSQGDLNQYKLYKCRNCKLVNLDLSNVNITDNQHKYEQQTVIPADYENDINALKAFQFIDKYVPVKGSYLEIGCGNGALLYFARKNGWEVRGLELSALIAKQVTEKLGIEVDVANFLESDNIPGKYNLVSFRHVLEHLPDSLLVMNKISGLIKEKGYAHFEFPNINSLSHRLQRLRTKSGFSKKKYRQDFVPAHCNEFCRESFEYLLSKTGFRLVRWETYSYKPISNFIYNHFHIGTKVRTIVQKI